MIAMIFIGLANGSDSETILTRAIMAVAAYSAVGWMMGVVADLIVRNSVEMNYRRRIEQLRQKLQEEK